MACETALHHRLRKRRSWILVLGVDHGTLRLDHVLLMVLLQALLVLL